MNNKYEHGANTYLFSKIALCKEKQVIDFSSNVNCINPKIKTNINTIQIKNYPDINYSNLKTTIKEHYNIKITNNKNNCDIELFNGSSSAIYSFFQSINRQPIYNKKLEINLYSPLYIEYKKLAELYKLKINTINRFNNINQKIKKNSITIFVNPSTPDGKLYNTNKLIQYWQKQNCTILIDESFIDFTNTTSLINHIHKYNKLYILKSFTKFYGCAGVRLGLIASSKNNIEKLQQFEPPWKISSFDSIYIIQCLKQKNFPKKSSKINNINKQLLIQTLENSKLFSKIYPSNANFILTKLKQYNARYLQKLLTPYLIYIRNCHNFDFLDDRFARFAVKDKKSINKLKYALNNITKQF